MTCGALSVHASLASDQHCPKRHKGYRLPSDLDIHPLGQVYADVWFVQFDLSEAVADRACLDVLPKKPRILP